MGSIHSNLKLKIKCPNCGESLYGYSMFDDYNQEEHITHCKKCDFRESYNETIERIGKKGLIMKKSCESCWNEGLSGCNNCSEYLENYVRNDFLDDVKHNC